MTPVAFPGLQSNLQYASAFLSLAAEQLRLFDNDAAKVVKSHYIDQLYTIFYDAITRAEGSQSTLNQSTSYEMDHSVVKQLKAAALSRFPLAPPNLGFGVFPETSSYAVDETIASNSPPWSAAATVKSNSHLDLSKTRNDSWSFCPSATDMTSPDRQSRTFRADSLLGSIGKRGSLTETVTRGSEWEGRGRSSHRNVSSGTFGAIGDGRPRRNISAGLVVPLSTRMSRCKYSVREDEPSPKRTGGPPVEDEQIQELTVGLRGTEVELRPLVEMFEKGLVCWCKPGLDQAGGIKNSSSHLSNGYAAPHGTRPAKGSLHTKPIQATHQQDKVNGSNADLASVGAVGQGSQPNAVSQPSWAAIAAIPPNASAPSTVAPSAKPAQAHQAISESPAALATEPLAYQNRVVWISNLPENTTITEVSAQITTGPLMSILLTTDASPALSGLCACVIFETAQAASAFLDSNAEEGERGRQKLYVHLSPNVNVLLGSPYPADADILSMRSPPLGCYARRRIKLSRARLFAPHGIPLNVFRADVHRLVGKENVEFIHFYNPGDVTAVFASVRVARYALAAFRAWANGKKASANETAERQAVMRERYAEVRVDFAKDFNEAPPPEGKLWTQYDVANGRICGVSRAVEIRGYGRNYMSPW